MLPRGLDVTHVAQVINIELPESPELLTHRVGRTGRMGRQGQAITLLGPEDLQVAAAGARVHPPHQTRPLAGCEGAAGQRQRQRSRDRTGDDSAGGNPPVARCAKRHVPHDAPRRPRAGKQRHAASRLPTARGRLAATRRGTADTAPELEGRELLRRYGRDPRRPDWVDAERGVASAAASRDAGTGRAAPERRARRRHQSICATCGETAETTFRPDPTRPVYCDGCYHDVRETRRAAMASPAV